MTLFFNTSLLVFFPQGLHFFLGLKLLSLAFDFKILKFSNDNSTNKPIFFPNRHYMVSTCLSLL